MDTRARIVISSQIDFDLLYDFNPVNILIKKSVIPLVAFNIQSTLILKNGPI